MGWGIFFVWLGLATARADKAAVAYDVSEIVDHDGRVTLLGGKKITLPLPTGDGRIYFDDLQPGANWGHAGRFRIQTREGERNVAVDRPPRRLPEATRISGPDLRKRQPIDFRVDDLGGKHKVTDPDRYWALLINGTADQRHWNDFSFLLRVLTRVYGYHPKQIVVADSVFKGAKPDLDGDGRKDIEFGSKLADVRAAVTHLKQAMRKNDRLLLVVNDHGGRLDGESTLYLYDREVKASELAPILRELPTDDAIAVYAQCYAGGFVQAFLPKKAAAVAASSALEVSWASVDFRFNEFLYHFISAVGLQKHDGTPVPSDIDGNGRVSLKEAFAYAQLADQAPESPFLESHPKSGRAMEVGIGY